MRVVYVFKGDNMEKQELLERIEVALSDYVDKEVELIVVADDMFYLLDDIRKYLERDPD